MTSPSARRVRDNILFLKGCQTVEDVSLQRFGALIKQALKFLVYKLLLNKRCLHHRPNRAKPTNWEGSPALLVLMQTQSLHRKREWHKNGNF
uniref:Uncharacterized protein n=1 Tax=Glossina austeni TaxID=7395 RepID=A0A1A9VQW3_GLOAU